MCCKTGFIFTLTQLSSLTVIWSLRAEGFTVMKDIKMVGGHVRTGKSGYSSVTWTGC